MSSLVIVSCLILSLLMYGADANVLGQRRSGTEDPDQGIIDAIAPDQEIIDRKGNGKRAAQNQDGKDDGDTCNAAIEHINRTCLNAFETQIIQIQIQAQNSSPDEYERIANSICGLVSEVDECIDVALKGCDNATVLSSEKRSFSDIKKTCDNRIDGNGDSCDAAIQNMRKTCLTDYHNKTTQSQDNQTSICRSMRKLDECIDDALRGCDDAIRKTKGGISALKKRCNNLAVPAAGDA